MKAAILALLAAPLCFAQATASNVHIDPLSLSAAAVRVVFDASAAFDNLRYRWAVDPATCSGGTGGTVSSSIGLSSGTYLVNRTLVTTGLSASSVINWCPELFSMGSWSTGATVQFTTPAAGDPTPLAPDAVNTTFPIPSGTPYTVASMCSNLQTLITNAVPGDTITIPAGMVCSGFYTIPMTSTVKTFGPANVRTSDSHITITSHGLAPIGQEVEVRLTALLDADGACLPGAQFHMQYNRCDQDSQGGWQAGYRYLAYGVDANTIELRKMDHSIASPGELPFTVNTGTEVMTIVNSETFWLGLPFGSSTGDTTVPANTLFQVKNVGGALPSPLTVDTDYYTRTVCTGLDSAFCATTISATLGGAAINLTTAGTGTQYIVTKGTPGKTFYIAPAPDPNGQYVTVIGGGTLPPIDTRITPADDAQLGIIEKTNPYPGTDGNTPSITFAPLAFNWHFRGLLMRTAANTDYLTTIDPRGVGNLVASRTGPENIIFDQVHVKCQPYPQRCGGQSGVLNDHNGRNVGTINSWQDDLNYWNPVVTGFTPTVASVAIGRLSQGRANTGSSIFDITSGGVVDFTISNGAGVTGTIVEYVAMNGTITVVAPNTVVGSFTACPSVTCSFTNAASPAYPTVTLGGSVRKASCPLATWTLTAGNLTLVTAEVATCTTVSPGPSAAEGTQANNSGIGPGPFIWKNNYAEGTGIIMHYADDARLDKQSYTVTHNNWVSLPTYCLQNAASNGLRYFNRNQLEFKGGEKILVQGNRFLGTCADRSNASVALAITPRNNSGYMKDLAVKNNFFASGAGGTNGCNVQATPTFGRPCIRQSYSNNLFTLTGYGYQANPVSATGHGWAMFAFAYGSEILINKNTHWSPTGTLAVGTYFDGSPSGLTTITSNLWTINGGADSSIGQFMQTEVFGCPGGAQAYTALTCSLASPYTFSGNAALPGYATNNSSPTPSGDVLRSTVCTSWNGVYASNCTFGGVMAGSLFFNQTTAASRYAAAEYRSPLTNDFRLIGTSPLIGAGASGATIGVDYEALMNASGIVRDIVITPAATSVTVCYTAPDTKDAWVGISTDLGATWSYNVSSGSAGTRCATPGGLSPVTSYMMRVLDYYDQTAALLFYNDMVTTQSFTTTAPTATGPASFRGSARVGVR